MKVFAGAVALAPLAAQVANAGFVKTAGTAFEVDGEPFYVFGTNAYWASEINWVGGAVHITSTDIQVI